MSDFKTNFLVTIVFDKDSDIAKQIKTECHLKSEIIKELQHLVKGKEIKHFIVADDEVINVKLKEELKTGHWISGHKETGALGITYTEKICSNCGWNHSLVIPKNYCPNCGTKMTESEK